MGCLVPLPPLPYSAAGTSGTRRFDRAGIMEQGSPGSSGSIRRPERERAMKAVEILREARRRGIELVANGDKIKLRWPDGALDDSLRAALARYKPAILDLLKGPRLSADGLPLDCCGCGSPNWWISDLHPNWACSYCYSRPEPFRQGRVVIVNGGLWARH